MGAFIDLTGHRFGRLRVLRRDTETANPYPMWACRCDCGTELSVNGQSLREGWAESCGCLMREVNSQQIRARNATDPKWRSRVDRGTARCPHCGNTFQRSRVSKKYCSTLCRVKAHQSH